MGMLDFSPIARAGDSMDGGLAGSPASIPSMKGLSKSASAASSGAQSFRSVSSIPVIGAHPYGTLQIHQPAESPLSREVLMKPLPDDPPPPLLEDDAESEALPAAGDGDIVLILDLPPSFTVGYDSVSFTARSFYGVRDLPPGAHFFWVSETEASTLRSGFWVVSRPGAAAGKIHVMQCDKFSEVVAEPASQVEARFQRDNIRAVYPKLAPYQYRAANANLRDLKTARRSGSPRSSPMPEPDFAKNTNIWHQLTCRISETLLARVTGRHAGDWAVHTSDRVKGALVLPAERELDLKLTSVVAGTELAFAFSQAARTFDLLSTGAARTEQAVDATAHITSLTDDPASGITDDDVVGELQFAFVAGMHLGNEACIQQWWHLLLALVFRAYALPLRRPALARALLQTITAQLVYNDRYLDGSVLDYGGPAGGPRDLRLALIVYKRRLNELLLGLNTRASPAQAAVGDAFSELEARVWRLGWDIRGDYLRSGRAVLEDGEAVEVEMTDLEAEDERGEFAAVVVELDDAGRQRDLVSWD